jgi:uncharacterized protein
MGRIEVRDSGQLIADRVRWARTSKERRQGLIGSPELQPEEALIITHAFQVHTFKMDFPIDVVFCNKEWEVKHIVRSLPPGRVTRIVFGASYAIEMASGSVPLDLGRGDRLDVSE